MQNVGFLTTRLIYCIVCLSFVSYNMFTSCYLSVCSVYDVIIFATVVLNIVTLVSYLENQTLLPYWTSCKTAATLFASTPLIPLPYFSAYIPILVLFTLRMQRQKGWSCTKCSNTSCTYLNVCICVTFQVRAFRLLPRRCRNVRTSSNLRDWYAENGNSWQVVVFIKRLRLPPALRRHAFAIYSDFSRLYKR